MVNKMDDPPITAAYINLFDQIWNDKEKLEDVTAQLCEHIASVYQENSPERIYFLMLYHIFNEFLEDISEDVLPNVHEVDVLTVVASESYTDHPSLPRSQAGGHPGRSSA